MRKSRTTSASFCRCMIPRGWLGWLGTQKLISKNYHLLSRSPRDKLYRGIGPACESVATKAFELVCVYVCDSLGVCLVCATVCQPR